MNTTSSVQDLMKSASGRYFAEPRGRWIFRSHSRANYELVPSVGRAKHPAKSRERYEVRGVLPQAGKGVIRHAVGASVPVGCFSVADFQNRILLSCLYPYFNPILRGLRNRRAEARYLACGCDLNGGKIT